MLCAVQFFHALDGEQIGSDAADLCSHPVEHTAELLQVGFAGGIVNGGSAFCQYGSHQNVGCTGHGRFIKQHIAALKPVGRYLIDAPQLVITEVSSQILNPHKVGVQTTATNLVSARLRNQRLPETCHHRTDQHHRPPKARTLLQELITLQISQIDVLRLKTVGINAFLCNRYSHLPHKLNQIVDIQNVRYIVHRHFLSSQQRGTDNLQNFVFGPLRMNFPAKPMSSFNYK